MAVHELPDKFWKVLLLYLRNKRVLTLIICISILITLLWYQSSDRKITSYLPSSLSTASSLASVAHLTSSPLSASTSAPPKYEAPPPASANASAQVSGFWPQFYSTLLAATPRCSLTHHHIEAAISLYSPGNSLHRQSLIDLDEADFDELREAHEWFVKQITSPSFPLPPFTPGSSGVVTTAGGEFLPEVLVAIRMLRRTGSTLPVDVFIADETEMEPVICDTVLKDLGATCHVLSQMIDAAGLPRRQAITRYQLKAFALLFSTFDNLLWIDADQMPLLDPSTLFTSEPFLSKGLVLWPDYWYPTQSPLFYKIAGIPDDRVPDPGARPASETGQLLLSKSTNLHTLELVAYYNFHGPSHYYKLLSQGAVGEGDKETFLAAALALDAPFWVVETAIDTIGWHRPDSGFFVATGMLQADPVADYAKAQGRSEGETVRPAFLHSEQHKPNAGRFARTWREKVGQRMFGPREAMEARFGFDLERVWWELTAWTACDLGGYVFRDWVDNEDFVDPGDVCGQARAVQRELFGEEGDGS